MCYIVSFCFVFFYLILKYITLQVSLFDLKVISGISNYTYTIHSIIHSLCEMFHWACKISKWNKKIHWKSDEQSKMALFAIRVCVCFLFHSFWRFTNCLIASFDHFIQSLSIAYQYKFWLGMYLNRCCHFEIPMKFILTIFISAKPVDLVYIYYIELMRTHVCFLFCFCFWDLSLYSFSRDSLIQSNTSVFLFFQRKNVRSLTYSYVHLHF